MLQRPIPRLLFAVLVGPLAGFLAGILAALLAGLGAAPLLGQAAKPDPSGQMVIRATTTTVVVDVVVTDRSGKPAQGLHAGDFVVSEDGHPQKLTSFDEHAGAQLPPENTPDLPPNLFTNVVRVKPTDALTVLLLDSLNTQITDQVFVRKEMLDYLKNPVPGKRMAIFTLGMKLRLIQGFTDDPAVLAGVLNNLQRGAGPETSPILKTYGEKVADQTAVSLMMEFAPQTAAALKQFQAEQTASQNDLRTDMTLQALEQLAHYLGGIPGRKNVVWFSGAFPSTLFSDQDLTNPTAVQRDYGDKIRKTDALLAGAQVAIYPFAAEGVAIDALYDVSHQMVGVTNGKAAQEQQLRDMRDDTTQRNADHTTMEEIAKATGGEAIYNTNGLGDALAHVADTGSYYYTLSYTPTNATGDGKYRKIQVKVGKGGYKLAYRRGYFAADAKAELAAQSRKPEQIGKSGQGVASRTAMQPAIQAPADRLRPFMGPGLPQSTEVPIVLRVQRGRVSAGAQTAAQVTVQVGGDVPPDKLKGPLTRYLVDFIVAARGLRLDPSPDGLHHGRIEAALVVYDRDGNALNGMVREVDLDVDAARYAEVVSNGASFRLEIDAPKDGALLRGGVLDLSSNLAGTLEIPMSSVVGAGLSPDKTAASGMPSQTGKSQ